MYQLKEKANFIHDHDPEGFPCFQQSEIAEKT